MVAPTAGVGVSRFLADEDFPLASVRLLREQRFDVRSVREDSPGIKDSDVLRWAVDEHRILLTMDRHYGQLIYRDSFASPVGIIYFRFGGLPDRERPARALLRLLADNTTPLEGHFVTLHGNLVRRRPLP